MYPPLGNDGVPAVRGWAPAHIGVHAQGAAEQELLVFGGVGSAVEERVHLWTHCKKLCFEYHQNRTTDEKFNYFINIIMEDLSLFFYMVLR